MGRTGLYSRQSGLALVAVLLVFAVAALVAGHIVHRNHLDFRRAATALDGLQADYYALGGEQLARQLIHEDLVNDRRANRLVDHTGEAWAAPGMRFDAEDGEIRIRISDAQARFNLNSLGRPGDQEGERLLARMAARVELQPQFAPRVLDWIDADGTARAGGAEDAAYGRGSPPTRAANGPMADMSELLVLGLAPPEYRRARSLFTVLPIATTVNINTASAPLLDALSGAPGTGAKVVALRARQPLESVAALAQAGVQLPPGVSQRLGVATSCFDVVVEVDFNGYYRRLDSLIVRDLDDKGAPRVRTLWRKLGQTPWIEPGSSQERIQDDSGR